MLVILFEFHLLEYLNVPLVNMLHHMYTHTLEDTTELCVIQTQPPLHFVLDPSLVSLPLQMKS